MDPKTPQNNHQNNITPQPTSRQPPSQPQEPKQSLWERRPQALAGDDPPPMYPAEAHSQNPTQQHATQQQEGRQYQQQQQPKAYNQQEMGHGNQEQREPQGQPGQVIYVQGKEPRRGDDAAVGFCAGCCAAACCCGCVVM